LDGQLSEFLLSGLQNWSLWLVSFLVGLRTYQHPGKRDFSIREGVVL